MRDKMLALSITIIAGMLRKALAWTMFLGVVFSLPAGADDTKLRFKGGIGVHPVSAGVAVAPTSGTAPVVESVSRNIVRGVQPAGQIWVIDKLDAKVSASGRITVDGKGLVLGGGDSAGRATGQAVLATLICQPTAPFTESRTSTAGVILSPNGDFKIDDTLSPLPPDICISPMLLIRNAANLGWFAVGIFRSGNDD
jgi:hypothetical protein